MGIEKNYNRHGKMLQNIILMSMYLVMFFLRTSRVHDKAEYCSEIGAARSCKQTDNFVRGLGTSLRNIRKQTISFDFKSFRKAIALALGSTDTPLCWFCQLQF